MRRPGGVWEVTVPVTNEELALAFQQGDADAGEELLRNVEGLIRHQASKMFRDGSLLEDLLQEGRAAVLAAAGEYDAERGALFPTYALLRIRAAMVEYLAKAGLPVSMPVGRLLRIRAAMVEYLAKAGLPVSMPVGRYLQLQRVGKLVKPSAEEKDQLEAICQGLGVSMGVAQALRRDFFSFWNGAASLDEINQMGSDFTSDPAYVYEQRLLLKNIAMAVKSLPARERNLVLRYLGMEGTALNFRELAVLLNYNGPSSAEKAYRRAVEKLKTSLWEGEYGQYRRARRLVNREMQDTGRR